MRPYHDTGNTVSGFSMPGSQLRTADTVIYWPSTEPSIKRCTYVNKRRNSGSRWKSDNYITRCHRQFGSVQLQLESVGDKMPNWEPAADRGIWALSDPRLSSPSRMRNKCCYGQKNLGSICSSLSSSPTHLTHTTNITLSRIKCERLYFYKEVYSFAHWSRHYCWLCFCLYLYMYMYAAIQQYCAQPEVCVPD